MAARDFDMGTVPYLLTSNIMAGTLVYVRIQLSASGCPTQILLRPHTRDKILDKSHQLLESWLHYLVNKLINSTYLAW